MYNNQRKQGRNRNMNQKTTEELTHEIKSATDIDDYLSANSNHMLTTSLSEYLNTLLLQKKIRKADVIRGSLLSRAYVYKIFAGEKIPSRDKLIALAFGLGLSDSETQKMLKLSGNQELYARNKRDALILFALQKNKSILEVNELLYDHQFTILNTAKE